MNFTDFSPVKDKLTEEINRLFISEQNDEVQNTDKSDIVDRFCFELQEKINKSSSTDILSLNLSQDEDEWDNKQGLTLFSKINNEYYTCGYVGVIEAQFKTPTGEIVPVTVNFHSRFDPPDDSKSPLFLMYVFEKAFNINGKIFDKMKIESEKSFTWDFLLMLLFFQQMHEAMKKGLYKQYQEFEHNDCNVKGRIDIARHIKENPLQNGKICYVTREYTVANDVNRLIVKAAETLERKYGAVYYNLLKNYDVCKRGLAAIKDELFDGEQSSARDLIKRNKKKIVQSVYRNYEPLRQTAILILKRLGINSFKSSSSNVAGILINMPGLWETFLYKEVFMYLAESSGEYRQTAYQILEGKKTIYPDFLLGQKAVFDAKYKTSWGVAYNNGDGNGDWKHTREDIYQVLSYMLIFNCKTGGVVFPVRENDIIKNNNDMPELLYYKIGQKCEDRLFCLVPYIIPNETNDLDFRKKIADYGEKLRQKLKEKS